VISPLTIHNKLETDRIVLHSIRIVQNSRTTQSVTPVIKESVQKFIWSLYG